ncbi:MAG: tetratricopeptide repeat protein [Bacteroidaceae bacterium]|nr:tetratricopeptide repeat protein [Bacteroidaceae bacterium]
MRKGLLQKVLLLAVTLLFVTAGDAVAKDKKPKKKAKAQTEKELTTEEQRKFELVFLEAERQQLAGNHSDAFELYTYALQINPESAVTHYKLSQYYLFLRNEERAEKSLTKAVEANPDNLWYKESLAIFYEQHSQPEKAIKVIESMVPLSKDKSELLMELVDLYSKSDDHKNAISALNRLEEIEGKSEELSMQKYRIYRYMHEDKLAFAEMEKLAEEYPNDLRYRVLLGDLYLDNGDNDTALRIYKEVEEKDSANVFAMLSKATYYSKTSQDSLYMDQLTRIVTHPNLEQSVKYNVMRSIVYDAIANNKDTLQMVNLIDRALASSHSDNNMVELCTRYMVSANVSVERVKPLLRIMLDNDPENDMARNQLLSYAISENNTEAVAALCKPAVEFSSTNPVYYYYLSISYYQQNKEREALEVMKQGLEHIDNTGSVDLIARMFSITGDLYHRFGDDDKAFAAYDSCLVYSPEEVLALNNYAYYLSLKKQNLDKAESMSAKSLEKEPDNATYVDTFAWILFQQGRYVEAKEYIDKAIRLLSEAGEADTQDNSNIIEHAGDIYFKTGDVKGAIELWQRALNNGSDSKTIKRKIQQRRYLE